jgi:hypothetical protein
MVRRATLIGPGIVILPVAFDWPVYRTRLYRTRPEAPASASLAPCRAVGRTP